MAFSNRPGWSRFPSVIGDRVSYLGSASNGAGLCEQHVASLPLAATCSDVETTSQSSFLNRLARFWDR